MTLKCILILFDIFLIWRYSVGGSWVHPFFPRYGCYLFQILLSIILGFGQQSVFNVTNGISKVLGHQPIQWATGRRHVGHDSGYTPVVGSEVDGVVSQAELVEQLDSSLSPQAPGPKVGHLLLGARAPMALSHLTRTNAHTHAHTDTDTHTHTHTHTHTFTFRAFGRLTKSTFVERDTTISLWYIKIRIEQVSSIHNCKANC